MIGNKIIKLDSVDSTNISAAQLLQWENTVEGTIITAYEQYDGRGQIASKWESEPGANLALSIILRPEFLDLGQIFSLNECVTLGIIDFLKELSGLDFKIKWPNDILFNNEKICGILIENSIRGNGLQHSIAGIGLNLNQKTFSDYIPKAVSLVNLTGKEFNVDRCVKLLGSKIDVYYDLLKKAEFKKLHEMYLQNLFRYNEEHFYKTNGEFFKATITNVLPDGRLVLQTTSKDMILFDIKEVQFVY